jgi:hypothetical protein
VVSVGECHEAVESPKERSNAKAQDALGCALSALVAIKGIAASKSELLSDAERFGLRSRDIVWTGRQKACSGE